MPSCYRPFFRSINYRHQAESLRISEDKETLQLVNHLYPQWTSAIFETQKDRRRQSLTFNHP